MPLLSTYNHFKALANISDSETTSLDVQKIEEIPIPVQTQIPLIPKKRKPKWEKAFPERLTIATMEGTPNSLKLKVEIETTNMAKKKSITALVDSGATGEFIDRQYAKICWFNLIKLTQPIPVYNVDGSPNEAGLIMEAVSLLLHYKNHLEQTTFCVTNLGKQKLLLGHSWLHKHNPDIDWEKGEVKMSRCPLHCCSRCWDELCQERIAHKAEVRRIEICSIGPLPEVDHDSEHGLKLDSEPILVEEGDHILATGLLPPLPVDIRASSTILQRLVEAFQTNEETLTLVPDYLREFTTIFSKQSFNVLLEPKEWDHVVELVPGSKPSGCKIYPLPSFKQKELDAFLKENLETGQIWPSKSLMSSPVFFIKKKEGSLRLVQDYRALNVITVKNK